MYVFQINKLFISSKMNLRLRYKWKQYQTMGENLRIIHYFQVCNQFVNDLVTMLSSIAMCHVYMARIFGKVKFVVHIWTFKNRFSVHPWSKGRAIYDIWHSSHHPAFIQEFKFIKNVCLFKSC